MDQKYKLKSKMHKRRDSTDLEAVYFNDRK